MSEIIVNGGKPKKDCPTSYIEANNWARASNQSRKNYCNPMWAWDCGFKLDFDGPLVWLSSRFYPPRSHYGEKWDGKISVMIGDGTLTELSIEAEKLNELKAAVEKKEAELIKFLSEAIYNKFSTVE